MVIQQKWSYNKRWEPTEKHVGDKEDSGDEVALPIGKKREERANRVLLVNNEVFKSYRYQKEEELESKVFGLTEFVS